MNRYCCLAAMLLVLTSLISQTAAGDVDLRISAGYDSRVNLSSENAVASPILRFYFRSQDVLVNRGLFYVGTKIRNGINRTTAVGQNSLITALELLGLVGLPMRSFLSVHVETKQKWTHHPQPGEHDGYLLGRGEFACSTRGFGAVIPTLSAVIESISVPYDGDLNRLLGGVNLKVRLRKGRSMEIGTEIQHMIPLRERKSSPKSVEQAKIELTSIGAVAVISSYSYRRSKFESYRDVVHRFSFLVLKPLGHGLSVALHGLKQSGELKEYEASSETYEVEGSGTTWGIRLSKSLIDGLRFDLRFETLRADVYPGQRRLIIGSLGYGDDS